MIAALRHGNSGLISGFPRQVTLTALEQLLLPLMHFLLLGFLPLIGMRKLLNPAFGAGCGQIFVADREAYRRAGGHAAIRSSRHDGITLPKAFRRAGIMTDLCDATEVASCRMYHNAHQVFFGLLKNADEGLASPGRILPFSFMLFVGQVLPVLLFAYAWTAIPSHLLRLLCTLAVRRIVSASPGRGLPFQATFTGGFSSPPCDFRAACDSVVLAASFRTSHPGDLEGAHLLDNLAMPIAPDFTLASASGESVHLYEALNASSVVLFFYLRAFTPVCMAEVCSFRDNAEEFRHLNAIVYGITSDREVLTRRFAAYHKLSFPLLLDQGNRVREAYAVPKTLGLLPGRSTYVIGQDRKILQSTHAGFDSSKHIGESLKFLRNEFSE